MGKLHLEVVTPENVVISREVESVVAPGSLGEFGVLEGHIAFLSGIVPGEMRYVAEGQEECLAVSSGFAEVSENKVSVLVDSAELACDIDVERASRALERAKERLKKEKGHKDLDFLRVESALKRALVRLKVAKKI